MTITKMAKTTRIRVKDILSEIGNLKKLDALTDDEYSLYLYWIKNGLKTGNFDFLLESIKNKAKDPVWGPDFELLLETLNSIE